MTFYDLEWSKCTGNELLSHANGKPILRVQRRYITYLHQPVSMTATERWHDTSLPRRLAILHLSRWSFVRFSFLFLQLKFL